MDLTLTAWRDFVSENCHAKFGGNWTTNKGETEGAPPSVYIITKYPSLNRVNPIPQGQVLPTKALGRHNSCSKSSSSTKFGKFS